MKKKRNWKVVVLSLIALACIALSFFIDWLFLVPAVIIFFINQKLLREK
jgi:hypothetical protein